LRLAAGQSLQGRCESPAVADLDSLPFPRWDLLGVRQQRGLRVSGRPPGGGFPVLSSRGCPEFCTYCPHRILAGYRARSVKNIVDELEMLCRWYGRPHLIFRDPLFSQERTRVLGFCEEVLSRGLHVRFEIETRLDRLDTTLLDIAYAAGLRVISYGVESVSAETLRRVGRRPIPEAHHREIVDYCRRLGILTAAQYVIGFLTDDWQSVAATIDFAIDMDSVFAQFKLLTPYPGTPLFKQMQPLIYETDWERFDGFTPTFHHPNLTAKELMFLLGAAYTRFYVRPSYLANVLRIHNTRILNWLRRLDVRAAARVARIETQKMSRSVTC
jgi:radical SAM superfamily enzyme YgiQ (UPF0313 family)